MGTWKALILTAFLVVGCAGCNPNGTRRPDSPLCTPILDGGNTASEAECTDLRGDYRVPIADTISTTLDGYPVLEKYVDDLEKENRKLRRSCNQ
jgi:hypothetical protein